MKYQILCAGPALHRAGRVVRRAVLFWPLKREWTVSLLVEGEGGGPDSNDWFESVPRAVAAWHGKVAVDLVEAAPSDVTCKLLVEELR